MESGWIPVTSRRNRAIRNANGATAQWPGHKGTVTNGFRVNRQAQGVSSFMFHRFPETWGMAVMWRIFKQYGAVSDIYIAKKRLRNGGKFGFVRFKNVDNRNAFLRKLNSIVIGKTALRVFNANERPAGSFTSFEGRMQKESCNGPSFRDSAAKNQRPTFAQVVQGDTRKNPEKKIERVEIMVDEDVTNITTRCIIGEARTVVNLVTIGELLDADGIKDISCKHLGGATLLFICKSDEAVEALLTDPQHRLRQWVKELRKWDESFTAKSRLSWIKVMGMPIQCWNETSFRRVAERWGVVERFENCTFQAAQSLVEGRVLIRTSTEMIFREQVQVNWKNMDALVIVSEENNDILKCEWVADDEDSSDSDDDSNSAYDESDKDPDDETVEGGGETDEAVASAGRKEKVAWASKCPDNDCSLSKSVEVTPNVNIEMGDEAEVTAAESNNPTNNIQGNIINSKQKEDGGDKSGLKKRNSMSNIKARARNKYKEMQNGTDIPKQKTGTRKRSKSVSANSRTPSRLGSTNSIHPENTRLVESKVGFIWEGADDDELDEM